MIRWGGWNPSERDWPLQRVRKRGLHLSLPHGKRQWLINTRWQPSLPDHAGIRRQTSCHQNYGKYTAVVLSTSKWPVLVLCYSSPNGLRQHMKCKLERNQSVMPGGKGVDDLKSKSMTAQSLYSFHEKLSKRMQMKGHSSYMQMGKASERRNHPICLGT